MGYEQQPALVARLAREGADKSASLADKMRAAMAAWTLFFVLMSSAMGIAFSAVVIRFFGGARGRKLYGVQEP